MQVISSDEIVLTDLTDSYSLSLSSDSFMFKVASLSEIAGLTFNVAVKALRGTVEIEPLIGVASAPEHVDISSSGGVNPTITVTLGEYAERYGLITLQIYLDDVVFEKSLTYTVLMDGEDGADGDSPYTCKITSSDGYLFHNIKINTTLTATVYFGGRELTVSEIASLGLTINWYKDNETSASATGRQIRVDLPSTGTVSYTAKVEEGST